MSLGVMSGKASNGVNAVSKTSAQLSQKEKQLIIEGLIAILEEDRLKPWISTGIADEYQRRYHRRLPDDWLSVVEESGPDVIEVETLSLTNVSKTLIQLPIKKIKTMANKSSLSPNPAQSVSASVTAVRPTPAPLIEEPPEVGRVEERPGSTTPDIKVAQLISLSPERPNPNTSPQSINPTLPVQTSAQHSSGDRYSKSLLDEEIAPFEQISSAVPNPVPNASERPTRAATNGVGDEPNAANSKQHITGFAELMNGTVEDVIFGGKPIAPPLLPPVNPNPTCETDFFDVVVVLAANPYNFIVVPYKNVNQTSDFYELKSKMLELYEKEENRIELPPSVIQKGIFVAAKADNLWYRVEVMSVLSESPFLVVGYLCDFGEHKTFELSNIQPLYNCFRDLPMQAIRASLATVTPIGTDWDVIQSYEFRKMVENKPFVATVYAIRQVDGQPVVSMSLCDTSGDDDVYVGSLLVQKRLANPVVTAQ